MITHPSYTVTSIKLHVCWFLSDRMSSRASRPMGILFDGRSRQAVQSCCVQSEGVKNKSKGLQETGLLAKLKAAYIDMFSSQGDSIQLY